jgi:hypothetical protein
MRTLPFDVVPFEELCRVLAIGYGANEPGLEILPGFWYTVDNNTWEFSTSVEAPSDLFDVVVDYKIALTFSQVFRFIRERFKLSGFAYQPNETGYWANSIEHKAKYDSYEEADLELLRVLIQVSEKIFVRTNN